ncbi:MAG: 2Fe-2S iron-sulfur cluster-binding protein [Panacagrimonas sp.]
MYKITFIEHGGERRTVEAKDGESLMQAATGNGVEGIVAECGGSCVCGTCHCYIDGDWQTTVEDQQEDEKMLVEFSEHYQPSSRLSCQIPVNKAMDGMVVKLPPSQP